MDKVQAFVEENKPVITSSVHLLIIIPLVFLAINPQYIPLSVPVNAVIYIVYALLLAGVAKHGYALGMYIKDKIAQKSVSFAEPPVKEEPQA